MTSTQQQEHPLIIKGKYHGEIKLVIDSQAKRFTGQIIADDMTVSGINVLIEYLDNKGNKNAQTQKSDSQGRFSGQLPIILDEFSIKTTATLITPVGNPLVVNSILKHALTEDLTYLKTEDTLNYLITESGDYLVI